MDNTLTVGKNEIAYTLQGKGQPLVFLHGFLENSSIWLNIAEKLTKNYKVLLVDLPGHGKSTLVSDTLSIIEMAESVQAIMDFLGLTKSIIFGHSLGGYVALELAKKMEIDLALVHSNFWNDDIKKRKDRDRVIAVVKENLSLFVHTAIPSLFYSENRAEQKDNIENFVKSASKMGNDAIVLATIGMRDRANNRQVLEHQRIAVIQGEFDPIIPEAKMVENLEQIKNKPYYFKISNCGHMGFLEQPSVFFEVILSIIDKFYGIKLNN